MSELVQRAEEWLAEEINLDYSAALERALQEGDQRELALAFSEPLTFGTAGLRGNVGFGPARMNEVVVAKASYGLACALQRRSLAERPVMIGYDGRAESRTFAEISASVLGGHGLRVILIDTPAPTPVIVYTGRVHRAAAIVAVTPSHNPRGDGGLKVYDDGGIQIVAPWDSEIAEAMDRCPSVRELPRNPDAVERLHFEVYQEYAKHLGAIVGSFGHRRAFSRSSFVYTPLHGVGLRGARLAAQLAGATLVPVEEQSAIDGSFPTTPFPNPEESGTLELLHREMLKTGVSLGIASDPDADRLSASIASEGGSPRRLSGDELGLLLASFALEATSLESPVLVSSVVSSPALAALASSRGARHESTLTGFKWLCRAALARENFVFAYEEALGYCYLPAGDKSLLDKDGLSALALLLAALSSREVDSEGEWLSRRLWSLASEVGFWLNTARSFKVQGEDALAKLKEKMRRLRAQSIPSWGGDGVIGIQDFLVGEDARSPFLGRQDLLIYDLASGGRLCVRPSGTEPKLKAYLHLVRRVGSDDSEEGVRSELTLKAGELLDAFSSHLETL